MTYFVYLNKTVVFCQNDSTGVASFSEKISLQVVELNYFSKCLFMKQMVIKLLK